MNCEMSQVTISTAGLVLLRSNLSLAKA